MHLSVCFLCGKWKSSDFSLGVVHCVDKFDLQHQHFFSLSLTFFLLVILTKYFALLAMSL